MKKYIYIYELILIAFIAFYQFIVQKYIPGFADLILVIFFVGSAFVLKELLGLRKDKSLVKNNTVQVVIISIMLFVLVGYLSGLIFGFLRNAYSVKFLDILKNIYPLVFMIISQELIRFMVAKKTLKDKKPLVYLTIIFIILDFALTFNRTLLINGLKLFVYITNTFAPSLARHVLCSYLCLHVSYLPGLILRLFFSLHIYIFPIFPDYGYYIGSVVGILIPYVIYLIVSKYVQYAEQIKVSRINKGIWYLNIPVLVFVIFIVVLVSGIFKYQIIAIGSGSMEPVYYKGDAVIFEKYNLEEQESIIKGMVLTYKHGQKIVTHRVIDIEIKNGERYYKTQGDNNDFADEYLVHQDDVIGIVKLRVKSIGWPTIWFQDLIS